MHVDDIVSTCIILTLTNSLQAFSKDEISQGKELQEKLEKFLQVNVG